jgi:predicted MPP superfamily phosphohydrolase
LSFKTTSKMKSFQTTISIRQIVLTAGLFWLVGLSSNAQIQLIYTSDLHYGLYKTIFQGASNVSAQVVNAAMAKRMNSLPAMVFPNDNGVSSGQAIGPIDYIIITGDISNRQESGIQSASTSWSQFTTDYLNGITLKNRNNQPAEFLLLPGNHDVSNAIGYYKAMTPSIDKSAMVNIYNLMMKPSTPKDQNSYNFKTDKINYSRNIGGVHFMFITMWADSANRVWMNNDLSNVSTSTPVVMFQHDNPDIDTKHLYNPNSDHSVNNTDKFENMVEEICKDGTTVNASSVIEQRGLANFIKAHPNIKAYFHGHSNYNDFYTWLGPDNNISLKVIRVDSPMKGQYSSTVESMLSFQVISLDTISKNITVRECLWNPVSTKDAPVQWGVQTTFNISSASGIDNIQSSNKAKVFPIPVNDNAHVALSDDEDATVAIYDLSGKLLQSKETHGSCDFNVSDLRQGIYTLRVICKDECSSQSTTIIKQ